MLPLHHALLIFKYSFRPLPLIKSDFRLTRSYILLLFPHPSLLSLFLILFLTLIPRDLLKHFIFNTYTFILSLVFSTCLKSIWNWWWYQYPSTSQLCLYWRDLYFSKGSPSLPSSLPPLFHLTIHKWLIPGALFLSLPQAHFLFTLILSVAHHLTRSYIYI